MRGFVGIVGGLLMLGCGQGSAARDRAVDSTTVSVPAIAVDSSSKAPAPPLTGYDSAFGPTFTVDSTGKVTPIGKKKP